LQSNSQVAQELEITKQEIDDGSGIDLGQHGVFRVADESLDLQVLLDETEEDLDLPAFFVDVGDGLGDGLGRQFKMVSEKDIASASGGVAVSDVAQGNGAFLGFGPGQPDGLVGDQSLIFIDFPARQHFIAGVALLSGDEEDFLGSELVVPGIVGVAQVLYDNGAFGQAEAAGFFDIRLPGRRNGDKGWQVAVVIQEGMQFDAALGAAEGSPRKERQAEAHHRGLQAEELVFELEFVLRGQRLAAPVHQAKQRLKEGSGALVVGIGKGGAGYRLDPQVVEALYPSFQAGDTIPQTDSIRELHGE